MEAITSFWNWFDANHTKYLNLHDLYEEKRETLINAFQLQLDKYCDQIYFEIGGDAGKKVQLIITAAGDPDYFEHVQKLVNQAPKYNDWEIIAFMPPFGEGFKTTHEGIEFNADTTKAIPLYNDEFPEAVAFQVCFDNFQVDREEAFMGGAYAMIDAVVGEWASVEEIDYVEVVKTPDNIEEIEYFFLSDLGEHITYVKTSLG